MFFIIPNKNYLSTEQLKTNTLLKAYYIVQKFPLHASDLILENYIKQQYKTSLKNMCIKLLLNLTFYKNDSGDLVLIFKNSKYDQIAQLITYGNGAIPGSKILQISLCN
jgi:hypothetical protein